MLLLTSWSCSEDTTSGPGPEEPTAPELSAQLQSAQEGTVTFTVTATEGAEVAYWFGEAAFFETVDVTPETIFRTGETITPVSFPATVTIVEQRPLHCPEAMPSPSDSTVTMYYIVPLPAWISHCCFPLP